MNRFAYIAPKTVKEAQKQITATAPQVAANQATNKAAIIKAGGVDLLDLMKEGIVQPQKIVSIANLPGMDKISFDTKKGLRIGALVKLSAIEHSNDVLNNYPALQQAISHAATPQIRNMGTMGGNLAQRPRCWYFRSVDHHCKKKGGDTCFALEGQNQIHGIFNTDICPCVHSSSIATALEAFGGQVEIKSKNGQQKLVSIAQFFIPPQKDVTCETMLESGDIITAVVLPAPKKNQKSWYIKQAAKESYDWALADVAVVLEMTGNTVKNARIVLGAAAPTPKRATAAEQAIIGKSITTETAKAAGMVATKGAKPLSKNGYKIPMFQGIVKACLMELA